MSQRLVDAVHRLQIPQTRFPSIDLSQLWPVRQKLSQLNRLKICHFHENVSNVNPFSVGHHFNLTRLVWVEDNNIFLFDFVTVMLQQERCWVSKNRG